ncbi:MAG: Na+/H+ antiporter subunit E [Thermoprotei archaeon]
MRFSPSTALLVFLIYIVFTGSATIYDVITGAVIAVICGVIVANVIAKNESKALNPIRWLWALIYFIKYITVIEAKAHLYVIKLLFKGGYKPGIVRVPVGLKTGYGKLLVANSITNTPGTVVVDLDDKYIYVNWINVLTEDPEEARKHISLEFEKFAKKIFE